MEQEKDFYELLGVSRDADAFSLKIAFRRLAKIYHPDKNAGDTSTSEKFRAITDAYRVLKDPVLRESYDLQITGINTKEETAAYLHVTINKTAVQLNEEVELTYSYSGEGRFFQRSVMEGWIITSGPLVDYRKVEFEGRLIKETVLNYTVCALRTGLLLIPPANIKIQRQQFFTENNFVEVKDCECYFKKEELAGAHPFIIYLHKERTTSSTIYRKTIVHQRMILIPRSDIAYWYHRVGRALKISWTICVAAWTLGHGYGMLSGILLGSLAGGINCLLMYRMMKMKSVFYNAIYHPLVTEYLKSGYEYGKEPSYLFFKKRGWKVVKSLFY